MKKLTVEIWSDIVCPWCAIGKRRFETALAAFPHRDDVQVVWRAFELDPSAPKVHDEANAERLARKYGRTSVEAQAMIRRVTDTAAKEGLAFDLLGARSGNTFDAHRVLHLAGERAVQGAVKERLMRGYMTEREAIGEPEVLARLAAEAGLDAEEVRKVLEGERYAKEVREEEAQARKLGINGVPFFVLGGQLGVSGAQPAQVLLQALDRAWASAPDVDHATQEAQEGAACSPEGCAQ